MESLPLEVVKMIVRNLSAPDLASCCATSHSWRVLFNQDLFWQQLSNQETGSYLARTPCRVEPAFVSPEVDGSGLDPVCRWRMNFMRETHLLNNWRSGRYRKQQLEGIPVMASDWICMMFSLFYQEDFVIGLNYRNVELWDVRCDPVPYAEKPCCLLPSWHVSYAFLCGDRLIVVQHLAVQVFQINLMQQTWPPEHTFFFEKDEPADFIRASNFIHKNKRYVRPSKCYVVGKYLIAINTKHERRMHIWDVVDGLKLKKEKLQTNRGWRFYAIKSSKTSPDDVIVMLYIKDSADTRVLVYSLLNLTYYSCVYDTASAGYCDLHGEKIVVKMEMPFVHWLIADYKTGELIHRVEEANCLNFIFAKIFHNKLIYTSNGSLNQINLSTGEKKQFLEAGGEIKNFQILGNKFICMQVLREEGAVGDKDLGRCLAREVWQICEIHKPLAFYIEVSNTGFIKTNRTNSKLIIEENRDLTLISLW